MKNKFGLSRNIPSAVKREVRNLSKNGCIICRCGIYQYEHIDPEFKDAKNHDPESICCLCATCHDKVTRGLLSKSYVTERYKLVQKSTEIENPKEFFDFHKGEAKLLFGSLISKLTPTPVFNCYGENIFSVIPGEDGEPGKIKAKFSDDAGKNLFEINENEWIGPNSYYDLEIIGQKFTVRMPDKRISLRLRHEAPGKVIIERLDMRHKDVHFLASEYDFAIGKYTNFGNNL